MSQIIIDTSKTWNVLYRHTISRTKCYKFTKDTFVDGYKYKELRFSYSEELDTAHSRSAGFLREEGASVYIRYLNGEEYLLYDFSLAIHDTVDMGFLNGEIDLQLRVDTITYWKIDNFTRKVLHMKPVNSAITVPQLWIEGIGSTHGLVEVGLSQMFGNESALLCFKDTQRDTSLWQSTLGLCYYSNYEPGKTLVFEASKQKRHNKKYLDDDDYYEDSVKENPAIDQPQTFTIQSNLQKSGLKLKIYNDEGELVENRIIKKDKDLKFDNLEKGEYLIQLTDSFDKVYATRKIKI